MRFSPQKYDLLKREWPAPYTNFDEANRVVYAWVKGGKLSPEQMAELIVINYKSFCY